MSEELRFKPAVSLGDLDGPDGNVFMIMGRVSKALRSSGQGEAGLEFFSRANAAPSYQAVLDLVREYVDVVEWRDDE